MQKHYNNNFQSIDLQKLAEDANYQSKSTIFTEFVESRKKLEEELRYFNKEDLKVVHDRGATKYRHHIPDNEAKMM